MPAVADQAAGRDRLSSARSSQSMQSCYMSHILANGSGAIAADRITVFDKLNSAVTVRTSIRLKLAGLED